MDNPNHTKLNLGEVKEKLTSFIERVKKIKLKKPDFFKGNNDTDNKLKTTYLKIALTVVMLIAIVALGITGYRAYEASLMAYDVYLGDEKIGTVREQDSVLAIMDSLQQELSRTYDIDVVLNEDVRFEETKAKDDLITHNDDLRKTIKDKVGFLVYGYVLIVNGEEVGALKTKEEIEDIINRIKEPYENNLEDNEIKEVKIVEDVKIEKKKMPLYKIGNGEALYNHLLTNSEEIRTHTVEVGESLWTIAKFYGLSVDDLIAANPDKKPERLQIGDEIKLVVPKPVLTVATVSEIEYTEKIKYETEIEYSDKMYKTEKKTKVAGATGEKRVLANEIRHNGILVEREIIEEEILKEPVTEVVVRGTKEPPKTVATGTFLMPTRGTISSRYGMRRGRMHYGIDIAAKTGTPIYAADGGKVVYAGYKGNYGYLVEIDHGNGFKTRYAHCSKILVKVGDKVYKGQHIANVGNTGRSTGSHLHFEVLKNGKNQNPANYVR